MGKNKSKVVPDLPSGDGKRVVAGIVKRAEGCPSWRFSACCPDGNWGWGEGETRDQNVIAFIQISKDYEGMTWPEIFRAGKAGKRIPKENLPLPARNELKRIKHDDVDDLVELRPSGAGRVWGVRHGDTLHLLWWDPDHTVYPEKRYVGGN